MYYSSRVPNITFTIEDKGQAWRLTYYVGGVERPGITLMKSKYTTEWDAIDYALNFIGNVR